jgi:hypothetical protein
LSRLFAFGTVPLIALAKTGGADYAPERAMKALASLSGSMPFLPRPAMGGAPAVIRLPDQRRRVSRDQACVSDAAAAPPPPAGAMNTRLAVLLAALAVPAMAAPGEFGQLPGDAPTEAEIVNARLTAMLADNPPLPFERPGMSFPGSAFYFLADPPSDALIALPTTDALAGTVGEAGREVGEMIDAGPAARPFFSTGGTSRDRALECLAQAVWYEAASESEAGQRAVAQVVLNRVAHPAWPGSVCGVVYQGSARATGCQFTFTCDGSLRRKPGGASWQRARKIAGEALGGSVYAPVGHATHYHTLWVAPYWAASLDHVGTIGAHRFYRNRGAAGRKEAFTLRYAGFEPGASERRTPPPPPAADAANASFVPATATTAAVPVQATQSARAASSAPGPIPGPILADPAYAGVGQVREGYASAGQWKSEAARAALLADERKRAGEGAPIAPPTAGKPRISGQKD